MQSRELLEASELQPDGPHTGKHGEWALPHVTRRLHRVDFRLLGEYVLRREPGGQRDAVCGPWEAAA